MALTQQKWDDARADVAWLQAQLRDANGLRAHGDVDLAGIRLVIVPETCTKRVLPPGNPALFLNSTTKVDEVQSWIAALTVADHGKQPHEVIVTTVGINDTVLVGEPRDDATAFDRLQARFVMWHEYGHAVIALRLATQSEYVAMKFEIDAIRRAVQTGHVTPAQLVDVVRYVTGRATEFRNVANKRLTAERAATRQDFRDRLDDLRTAVHAVDPSIAFPAVADLVFEPDNKPAVNMGTLPPIPGTTDVK